SLPQYREVRKRYGLFDIVRRPELCAEVTLQPVEAHGVDAAVMFTDIMFPVVGMGVDVELVENVGPVISRPIATRAEVDRLRVTEPDESAPFILEAVRLVRALPPPDYEEFVAPYSARILRSVEAPTIHFGTGTTALLVDMAEAGGDVIGLDWRIALDRGWALVGDDRGVQGNLDPAVLLGPWARAEAATRDIPHRSAGR